jgi:hypothetical protein
MWNYQQSHFVDLNLCHSCVHEVLTITNK